MKPPFPYKPVEGKTYSLFGKSDSSAGYYKLISDLADRVLVRCDELQTVLKIIPAVGIPLDANRCIRWMGSFHENSVNLEQLELLIENKNK